MPQVAVASEQVAFFMCGSGGASPSAIEGYYDILADDLSLSIEEINAMLDDYTGSLGFDPRPYLEAVQVPGLWIYGGMDRSNPTAYDIKVLNEMIQEHGKNFTILLFPFADHDLVDVRTGEPPEELLPRLFEWLEAL